MTTIASIILDIGLGASALALARELRRIIRLHEGRLQIIEKHLGIP